MLAGAGRKTRVHQVRGCSPLFLCNEAEIVSELSIYHCIHIDKKHIADSVELSAKLSKKLSDYRLFQAADMFCSMELITLKLENSSISASEIEFFGNLRDLKKNYLKPLAKFEWK